MRSLRALGRSLSLSAPPQRFLHILSLGSKGASHKRITATPPSPHWAEPAHIADPIGDTHCRKEPIFEQEVISNSGFCNLFNQDPRRAHAIYTLQVPPPSLPPSPEYFLVLFLYQRPQVLCPTGPFHHDLCTSSLLLPPKHVLLVPGL